MIEKARASVAAPDPSTFPILFNIAGPRGFGTPSTPTPAALWIAQAQLRAWTTQTGATEDPWLNAAARNLFVHWPKTTGTIGLVLRPGLILVKCRILSAQITMGTVTYNLSSQDGSTPVDTVLLLETRADNWVQPGLDSSQLVPGPIDSNGAQFRCVGGEFPIQNLTQINSVDTTRNPSPPPWANQLPMLSQLANPFLTADGFTTEGQASFPWQSKLISNARYLVQVQLARPNKTPSAPLLVICDRERLSDYKPAATDLLSSFTNLAAIVSPTNSDQTRKLKWFGLEPAVPGTTPDFSWDLTPANDTVTSATAVLRLDNGWRLFLTDQPPRAPNVGGIDPLGVLTANPSLAITGGGRSTQMTVKLSKGTLVPPGGTTSTAAYGYNGQSGQEGFAFRNLITVYDAVVVAQILRNVYGVGALPSSLSAPPPATTVGTSSPGTSEGAPNQVPEILWSFCPLDDGWAQLPIVNLTEQYILDKIPPALSNSSTTTPTLLTGAASFGNDRAELYPLTNG
jgi:hypothetical protein